MFFHAEKAQNWKILESEEPPSQDRNLTFDQNGSVPILQINDYLILEKKETSNLVPVHREILKKPIMAYLKDKHFLSSEEL